MRPVRNLVVAVLLLRAAGAAGYRPFDGTDGDVAEYGALELELGPLGWQRTAADDALVVPAIVANFGINPAWELVIEGRNELPFSKGARDRLTDTGVFLKGLLREGVLQEQTGISLATEIGVLLPTVNDEPGSGASAALIASYAWPALVLHLNLQGMLMRDRAPGYFVSLMPRAWAVRPVAELSSDARLSGPVRLSGLLGLLAPVGEHVVLDAACRVSIIDGAPELEVRAGLTWSVSFIGEPVQPEQQRPAP